MSNLSTMLWIYTAQAVYPQLLSDLERFYTIETGMICYPCTNDSPFLGAIEMCAVAEEDFSRFHNRL